MTTASLITGAASGIGAAIAQRLALDAQHLVLHTAQNEAGLESVAAACQDQKCEVTLITGDLSDSATVNALIAGGRDAAIDSIVLNAGFPDWRDFESLDVDGLDRSLQVMVGANFELLTALTQSAELT